MMNEESTAINSPHNNAGRRVTEIDQVAGVVESSLHENEINRPHNNAGRRKGNNTINETETVEKLANLVDHAVVHVCGTPSSASRILADLCVHFLYSLFIRDGTLSKQADEIIPFSGTITYENLYQFRSRNWQYWRMEW